METLWFYLIVSIIVCIVLFFLNKNKKKEIEKQKSEIISLKNKIDNFSIKTKLLQAEYLKLKEYLILKIDNHFKESPDFQEMPPLESSIEYHKIINQVLEDYHKAFSTHEEAMDKVSSLMADYITYPILYK